jgi:hypothetical protein
MPTPDSDDLLFEGGSFHQQARKERKVTGVTLRGPGVIDAYDTGP